MSGKSTFTPTTPNGTDSYICYQNAETCLILNAGNQPIVLSELNLTAKNCLIYSETISITTSTLAFSGTSLGLFCSVLNVTGRVTIEVAGSPGADVNNVVSGPGLTGNHGTAGGTVWVYVEQMTDDLVNSLFISANGGDGGNGGTTSDPTQGVAGGVGGDGGKGGSANLYYGNVANTLLQTVRSSQNLAWPSQVMAVGEVLAGCQPPAIPLSWVSAQLITDSKTQVTSYQSLVDSLKASVLALTPVAKPVVGANPYPLATTSSAASECIIAINNTMSMTTAPPSTSEGSILTLSNTVISSVLLWSQNGSTDEAAMVTAMDALTKAIAPPKVGTDLEDLWLAIATPLSLMLQSWNTTIARSVLSADGGRAGHGGSAAVPSNPDGLPGTAGTAGTTSGLLLNFDGLAADTAVAQAYASPDQCSMLLDVADGLFFTNNPTDVQVAASIYAKLIQRLAFVPRLLADASASPVIVSDLQKAYTAMETSQLTYSSISGLQLVYEKAKTSLNRINLQQDLFGHPANWAPRLSVKFYESDLSTLLSNLQSIEASISQYFTAIQTKNDKDYIGKFQTVSGSYQKNSDKIEFITGPNGILRTSGNKIATLTPELTQARTNIQNAVTAIQSDIQKTINMDPKMILEAFATVGTATTPAAAAAKGAAAAATVAYKAWTTVDDINGNPVNKDYLISQLGSCDNTLLSLKEAYSVRADGHVSVDDPGALKIVAAADALEAMVNQYKNAISGPDADALKAALDAYITLITTRNNAVISYNAGLQMLHEAYVSEQHDQKQMNVLGQAILTADPYIPAIYKWLMRAQDDTRYQIMQRLNYAARALQFWGLYDTFEFAEPGPLVGYTQLNQDYGTLTKQFNQYTEHYAQTPWIVWPSAGEQGLLGQLDAVSLASFKTANSLGKYELRWTVDAGADFFAGKYNVRLSQLRVWIIGASVTSDPALRQLLTVNIQHSGNEVIVSPAKQDYAFVHDAVQFQFEYDTSKVKSISDCTSKVIFTTELIDSDDYVGQNDDLTNAIAPIGPYTMWRITVDPASNKGLNMSNVSAVYIEFCGRSMASTDPSDDKTANA